MKKLLALFLVFICLFGCAFSESSATPTDLVEIDDDDYGEVTAELGRQVYVDFLHQPQFYGEEATLVAILINFLPEDKCTFTWEYSKNGKDWILVPDANKQTYTFTITKESAYYHWRATVTLHNERALNLDLQEIEDYNTPLGLKENSIIYDFIKTLLNRYSVIFIINKNLIFDL